MKLKLIETFSQLNLYRPLTFPHQTTSELKDDWINRLFSGLRPKQEFFTLVEQQYGVLPKALQGGTRDMKDINDWVAQQTGGKVQRLLAKALPRNPGVNTVSAAYFKGMSKSPNPLIIKHYRQTR